MKLPKPMDSTEAGPGLVKVLVLLVLLNSGADHAAGAFMDHIEGHFDVGAWYDAATAALHWALMLAVFFRWKRGRG